MTHRFTKYRLSFPDGLHLDAGTYGFENTEVSIHSDTLFSALCCAAVMLEGDDSGVKALKEKARFSSAFPFAGGQFFFPKPLIPRDFDFPNYSDEKKFRKLKYLHQSLLEADLAGNLDLKVFKEEEVKDGCWLTAKLDDEDFRVFKLSERPRITTGRVTHAAEIYHFSEVHFDEDGGLFFLADFSEHPDFKTKFESYLRLLGDEGIGADGTVGKGFFEITVDENVEIKTPGDANAFLMLSLYNPLPTEAPNLRPNESYYEILTRRGWSSAPGIATWRRRSLRMFGEGSVL
ncbi:MAG: type III-A CRISPR-associated RAMP protein Csm4, partial [Saprospiraceae bacterium]